MAKVTLLYEDVEGEVPIAFRADFKGGYDPTSPAHRLATAVIGFMDRECAEKKEIGNA